MKMRFRGARSFCCATAFPKINTEWMSTSCASVFAGGISKHSPLLRLLRLALPPVSNIFKLFLNMAAADVQDVSTERSGGWGGRRRENCISMFWECQLWCTNYISNNRHQELKALPKQKAKGKKNIKSRNYYLWNGIKHLESTANS